MIDFSLESKKANLLSFLISLSGEFAIILRYMVNQ